MIRGKKAGLLITILFLLSFTLSSQNIEVTFTGLRSTKGEILVSIFKDENSFKTEKPSSTLKFKKAKASNGQLKVTFSLDAGTYGFCLVDDENSDGEINYNFIGIPKEGFGFSNYYHSGLTKPKFESFKFIVRKNQTQKIVMKVRYMS